ATLVASPSVPTQHTLRVRYGGFGEDAVAEIENERPSRKRFQHRIDFPIQRGSSGQQCHGIQISLPWLTRLNFVTGEPAIDHPIESNRIERHLFNIAH